MLKEDIRGLLKAWAALISNSSLILLSVPKTMRPTLFDEENSVILDKRDVRIRYVPFMTDKPTFETIQSIHTVCSTVYFKEITDSPFRIDDADEREGSLPQTVQTVSKLSANLLAIKEEDSIIQRSALISCPESVRLFDILQRFTNDIENKDKTDLLASIDECLQCIISFYGKNHVGDGIFIGAADDNVDSCSPVASLALSREMSLNLNAEEVVCLPGSLDDLWTALHWASSIGMPELISRLLIAGADPTARDVRNRTPYYLCKTKEARDAFRRYRATAELKWNWTDAGVPEALTTEMERIQKEKEKEKKKRAKLKKAEQKEKQDGMELEQLEEVDYMTVAKTTEPPKARAFAAGDCACCSKSLFRVTPTSINGQDCCSQECAAKLKRKLAADAALARFKNSSSAINK